MNDSWVNFEKYKKKKKTLRENCYTLNKKSDIKKKMLNPQKLKYA